MTNLVIMIIVTIAAASVALFSGYSFFNTSQTVTDQQLTQARLEETAAAIQANIMEIDGTMFVPAGVNGADYMQVPAWITPNARSAGNVPFLYCPYAPLQIGTGTATTVEQPGAGNYAIQTYSGPSTSNRSYVVNSAAPDTDTPDGTLAVITAAPPGSTTPPTCSSITSTSAKLTSSSAGSVLAITAGQYFKERVYAASGTLYLHVSTTGAGDYSGRDASNAMTLNQAISFWRAVKPGTLILRLATGSYTMASPGLGNTNFNAGNDRNLRLILRGDSGAMATTTIAFSSAPSTPTHLVLENVTLDLTGVTLTTGPFDLFLNNVTFSNGNIAASEGGNIFVTGATTLAGTTFTGYAVAYIRINAALTRTGGSSFFMYGGRMDVLPGATVTSDGSFYVYGSHFKFGSGSSFTNAAAATVSFQMGEGGILDADTSSFSMSTTDTPIMFNRARVSFLNTPLLVPNGSSYGIRMTGPGILALQGLTTVIGSVSDTNARPTYPVYAGTSGALKGGSIGAGLPILYAKPAGLCWYNATSPNLVSRSNEGNGQNSTPTAAVANVDYLLIDNSSAWSCVR